MRYLSETCSTGARNNGRRLGSFRDQFGVASSWPTKKEGWKVRFVDCFGGDASRSEFQATLTRRDEARLDLTWIRKMAKDIQPPLLKAPLLGSRFYTVDVPEEEARITLCARFPINFTA